MTDMTRHQFLAQLHEILKPVTYLEVGVQHGWSLELAIHSERAIGIDPEPLIKADTTKGQAIYQMTSDTYFGKNGWPVHVRPIDMAFIDGMHLAEYAFRDFLNIEKFATPNTVVVFDDVLPRNQVEASRTQCPGDWTGDVWRVFYALRSLCPDLKLTLVDTQPTGLLLVKQLNKDREPVTYDFTEEDLPVPEEVLNRDLAHDPRKVLTWVV